MTYNTSEIVARVAKRRRDFILRAGVIAAVMLAALIMIIMNVNTVLTFSMILALLIAILLASLTVERYSPLVLFSREIVGTNIKEDEYAVIRKSGPGMRYKQEGAPGFGGPPIAPNTGANRRRTPPSLRAAVYLRLEDGNLIMLRGLYKAHADIYEDGDTLLKHAGTKYPIVISRDSDSQPCPICGEVNYKGNEKCASCRLEIINE